MTTGDHLPNNTPELRNWYQVGKIFSGEKYDKRRRIWVKIYTEYGARIEVHMGYYILRGRNQTFVMWIEHRNRHKQNGTKLHVG